MKNIFLLNGNHTVTEANINYYATPFVHPSRVMKEHDFIYMLKGKWKFGQNDEVFELENDCILILAAENMHYGISPCTPDTKTMYFHILCENDIPANNHKANKICLDSLIDVSLNKNVKRFFSELVNCKLSGNQAKADIYFDLLLCELAENHLYTSDGEVALKIKNFIHSAPEKFFRNAELAEMANVSVKTAENKFKEMFGITIHKYILNFKINEAKAYFESLPEISIKEVAYNLGFYDEYHFSKQFKKATGISPVTYKKLQQFL